MVRPERFERPTPWFVAKYSIQLSYGRIGDIIRCAALILKEIINISFRVTNYCQTRVHYIDF